MGFGAIPRRWRWALVGSLAVNLLVAGLTLGAMLQHAGGGPRHGAPRPLAPLVDALPDAERLAFRAEIGEPRRERNRERDRGQRRARFEALLAALRAEPFDAEGARALLSVQRRLGAGRMEVAEAILIGQLAAMTAGERAAYADRLAAMVADGPRGR